MRFCGMCGTPLPYAPLTTPGAQSTLSFTRVPVESGPLPQRSTPSSSSSRSAVAQDIRERGARMPSPVIATASTAVEEPLEAVEAVETPEIGAIEVEHSEVGTIEAAPEAAPEPAAELVPDVSLDEYVQNFHYEPPAEPTEVTMRGDASVAEQQAASEAIVADAIPAEESQPDVVLASAPYDGEAAGTTDEVEASSVESRLGLEPDSPAEIAAERPRFLDLGEPAEEATPATSGTSTIVGPSFLGLSDAPQIDADDGATEDFDEAAPRTSHWRKWLAAAAVIVIAVLGIVEWRSQSHQTDNGPVEVMKAKVRDLKNGGQSPAADQSADNGAKPDMQVQEQPKPQPPAQAATPPQNSSASSNAPAGNAAAASQAAVTTVKPPQPTAPPPNSNQGASVAASKPSPAIAAASKAGATSPAALTKSQAEADKPKTARQDQGSSDETAASKSTGAGADELDRAKNASDSAAEAAWLWKSTAKGNPDAPVMLADMYMKGDGVPRSCEQAVVLLKTAAAKENAHARNRLASMYATGNCVQRNRVEAYRWLSSALVANPHSDWAQQNKNLIWQQMTPEEQAEAQKYR